MINLYELGKTKKQKNVTTAAELIEMLKIITGKTSNETHRQSLNNFKILIWNLPTDNMENPYRSFPIMEQLNLPDDLYYIFCKMAYFLKAEQYLVPGNSNHSKASGKDYICYSYNIPLLWMPVVTAFISSLAKVKNNLSPVAVFFQRMDAYIQKYPFEKILEEYTQYSSESLLVLYKEWMRIFLARDYFIHLEELYKDCATDQHELQELKYATMCLTQLVTFPAPNCIAEINDLDGFLQEYRHKLDQEATRINADKPDYHSLYDCWEPFPIRFEANHIDNICVQFKNFLNWLTVEIQNYISSNRKSDSPYPLALQNISDFAVTVKTLNKSIEDTKSELMNLISVYYKALPYCNDIMDAIQKNELLCENTNMQYTEKMLSAIFAGALSEVLKVLEKLQKYVELSSGKTPENYSAKTTDNLKSFTIEEEISFIQEKAIAEVGKYNFPTNFPSLKRHKQSYVSEQGFFYKSFDALLNYVNMKTLEKRSCANSEKLRHIL